MKDSIDALPDVMTVADVQKFLKISKTTAYSLVSSKVFHVVKIGRVCKIPKRSFVEWLLNIKMKK